jgi:hypothetical protein
MNPDPKWFDISKMLELEHMFVVALASALFLGAAHWGWVPPPARWMTKLAWAVLLLFGCLSLIHFLKGA